MEDTPKGQWTPSEIPYTDVCNFSIPIGEVAFSATSNYKVYLSTGANPSAKAPVKGLFYTRAGTNVLKIALLQLRWMSRNNQKPFLQLKSANQEPMKSEEVSMLHPRISYLYVILPFGVVDNVVVGMILETAFIATHVRRICPAVRKLIPWH